VDNASGNIYRACIGTVSGRNVVVRNNDVSNYRTWGIFTSHSHYVRMEDNKTSFNNSEDSDNHGIYASNATVDPVIVGNEVRGNRGAGLHMNGDLSQGGNGLITGARIEGNVIRGNGARGDRRSTATACRTPHPQQPPLRQPRLRHLPVSH
jgi:hypothetical protein